MRRGGGLTGALVAMTMLALSTGSAGATTICVPSFHAACPNAGGNVAEPDLEKAMGIDGWDGEPDQVIVAGGTFTEDGTYEPPGGFKAAATFEPEGSDELTIVGAGEGATYLTSSGTGNSWVVNLGSGGNVRDIVVRDLTVSVPVGFADGLGAGVQLLAGDVLEAVTVESHNDGSDGVIASGVGSVARDVHVAPAGSGAGSASPSPPPLPRAAPSWSRIRPSSMPLGTSPPVPKARTSRPAGSRRRGPRPTAARRRAGR